MYTPPSVTDLLDYVLIDEDKLQARIAELASQISLDYKIHGSVMLVGILKGSTLFMVDLMKHLGIPHTIDFMDISSYGRNVRESSGDVRVLMDLHEPIKDRHVILVEDIVDSGNTLSTVMRMLEAREPASLKICALLDKSERREVDVKLDYVGFSIPNAFVFGYGLDIDEYYRNLPYIGVVKPGSFVPFE
jgi:hypoxanthine phosphoribosyltransferase